MTASIGDRLKAAAAGWVRRVPQSRQSFHIGLYFGKDALNLVQMQGSSGQATIRAATALPYGCSREEIFQRPPALKSLVKQAYAMQPFKGRHVVSCLPAKAIKIITVAYKPTKDQTDSQALVAEMHERLHDELNNMVLDFMPIRYERDEASSSEALVALTPRQTVMSYLELLTKAGLEVEALDVGPAALARLVRHAGARGWREFPTLPNALLINIGANSGFLTLLWGRRLILDRAVDFSENRLLSRLKQVLNLPQDLAERLLYGMDMPGSEQEETSRMIAEVLRPEITVLLQEINKTLVYMASKTRGKSIDVLYLASGAARFSRVLGNLQEQLRVPVELINPISIFAAERARPTADESLGMKPGITLATGLALRGVSEHG